MPLGTMFWYCGSYFTSCNVHLCEFCFLVLTISSRFQVVMCCCRFMISFLFSLQAHDLGLQCSFSSVPHIQVC